MTDISASVGLEGNNAFDDVLLVQRLLTAKGFSLGRLDGSCGPRTIEAITAFQRGFMAAPDGRVEPGGKTLKMLNEQGATPADVTAPLLHHAPLPEPLNPGLRAVNNQLMLEWFGAPRSEGDYDEAGKSPTNPLLVRNIVTDSVGPFKATGLRPAVLSLQQIMEDIKAQHPQIYPLLSSAGMLNVRFVRGSTTSISNHSWGTAIDLKIAGRLDDYGDGMVLFGLTLIAPIFNRHGWYWGAAFRKEDSMHFEGGRALVERWRSGIA